MPIRRGDQTRHVATSPCGATDHPPAYLRPDDGRSRHDGRPADHPADFRRKQLTQQGNPLYSATRRRSAKQEAERSTLTDACAAKTRYRSPYVPVLSRMETGHGLAQMHTD